MIRFHWLQASIYPNVTNEESIYYSIHLSIYLNLSIYQSIHLLFYFLEQRVFLSINAPGLAREAAAASAPKRDRKSYRVPSPKLCLSGDGKLEETPCGYGSKLVTTSNWNAGFSPCQLHLPGFQLANKHFSV